MKINVLAVGPADLKDIILSISKEYPEIAMSYAVYHSNQEIVEVVQAYEKKYDLLLFAGSLPYAIVNERLSLNKRMAYIPFRGTALYRVLFQLIRSKGEEMLQGRLRISIDNLEKFEVEECLDELDIPYGEIFYENQLTEDTNHLVEFHYTLWKTNKIDVAITSIGSVYERLAELRVPASRIIPTRSSIRSTLEKVRMKGISLQQLDSQIATGIIAWDRINQSKELTEYQIERKILALKNILINYGEKTQSVIKWLDERQEVKFITTRGALEFQNDATSDERKLLEEIFNKTEIQPRMGIGIGTTAIEAEMNAREALAKAPRDHLSFFIRDHDGLVHGPIGGQVQLSYSIRNHHPQLMALSKRASLSGSTINRVLSYCNLKNNDCVTTADLADGLGITVRSARRILNKLEEANVAVVTGEEQPLTRGRPRQVYSLARLRETMST